MTSANWPDPKFWFNVGNAGSGFGGDALWQRVADVAGVKVLENAEGNRRQVATAAVEELALSAGV